MLGAAVTAAFALVFPGAAIADDAAATPLRTYPFTPVAVGRTKSINPEGMHPPVGAPSQNFTGPEKSAEHRSLIPDPQNSIARMLQARELSFAPKKLEQDPRATNSNVDLSAIKLRVSRDSVMLRAQFTFN